MQQDLATVIDVLRPVWDGVIPPEAITIARQIASELPPVAKGGFEFDLLAPLTTIDVLQCFDVAQDGMEALASFLAQRSSRSGSTWTYLERLTQDLLNPARPWHRAVESVWLEIDAAGFLPGDWEPSVFLEFNRATPLGTDDLIEAVRAMPLRDPSTKTKAVQTIAGQLGEDGWISHVGAMLSREDTPLRINVKRLDPQSCSRLLTAVLGRDDTFGLAAILENAYRSTLCLDVTDRILPRAGVEYLFSSPPAREKGWKDLAENTTRYRLDRSVWAVMERWDAELTPLSPVETWPDRMILADLASGEDHQENLQAIPSHIKVTRSCRGHVTAKGYVGFQPRSRPIAARDREARRISAPADLAAGPERTHLVPEAVERGIAFLLDSRTQNGLWRDFEFAQLHSDEWVTGYVGTQLLECGSAKATAACRAAWHQLRSRRAAGAGWGYQKATPPDADSTAWVLSLATALGETDCAHVSAGLYFLVDHRGNKGFRTYDQDSLGRWGETLPDTAAHKYWQTEQVEVAASAARAGLKVAIADLISEQRRDGSWESFWFDGSEYVTGLAAEALRRSGDKSGEQALHKAYSWARARLADETNSFKLAWLLRILMDAAPERLTFDPEFQAAIEHLIFSQLADGSWPSSCVMKVPVSTEPGGAVQMADYPDCHRVFTTSTIIGTLGRIQRAKG